VLSFHISNNFVHRLYISPKLPPTPVQRKITPREWLSEGRGRDGRVDEDLPSLEEVRKSLIYNIDEAENLGDVPSYNHASSRCNTAQLSSHPVAQLQLICPCSQGESNLTSTSNQDPTLYNIQASLRYRSMHIHLSEMRPPGAPRGGVPL
jgi:hypothetical protein